MKKHNVIHVYAALKSLFIHVFGNKYILILLDTIATLVISIHTANINLESKEWINKLILYVTISISINIICAFAECLKEKQNTLLGYSAIAYDIQNKLNSNTSTKIYRVNKKVTSAIRNGDVKKGEFDSIADFQTLSFDVCKELHAFISECCNCEECEVTIFQRFTNKNNNDFVTMIAYKNSQNRQPATYGQKFYLNQKNNPPLFLEIFKDINADIRILHNQKAVKDNFNYLEKSKNREQDICQYVGIPIRTNRNKVELLLQIDVSKKGTFGIRYKTVKKYAENIFLPFATLIHCSYERDLVLNKFYDVLEEKISHKARK